MTPASRLTSVKIVTAIIETETIIGIVLSEIKPTSAAPIDEPMRVNKISGEIRFVSIAPRRRKGIVAPTDINVKPNIFVATATRGSTPNWNITGTVIKELLPVTTPMALVMKNSRTSKIKAEIVKFTVFFLCERRQKSRAAD